MLRDRWARLIAFGDADAAADSKLSLDKLESLIRTYLKSGNRRGVRSLDEFLNTTRPARVALALGCLEQLLVTAADFEMNLVKLRAAGSALVEDALLYCLTDAETLRRTVEDIELWGELLGDSPIGHASAPRFGSGLQKDDNQEDYKKIRRAAKVALAKIGSFGSESNINRLVQDLNELPGHRE